MGKTERTIAAMIRKAIRNGQSVNDLLDEIDYDQINDTDEDTVTLVTRLARKAGYSI